MPFHSTAAREARTCSKAEMRGIVLLAGRPRLLILVWDGKCTVLRRIPAAQVAAHIL